MEAFESKMLRGGIAAIQEASQFFLRADAVHLASRNITRRLQELGIPHAVVGDMALVAHGYDRTTVGVEVLVTPDGLEAAHEKLPGLGYLPAFAGSRHLRDAEHGVKIEFLVTGGYPGDGKPKPVAFPDPADCAVEIDGVRYVKLPALIELKLASGMTNPERLRNLADVQELIRCLGLKAELAQQLHPYVREKFLELLSGVQADS